MHRSQQFSQTITPHEVCVHRAFRSRPVTKHSIKRSCKGRGPSMISELSIKELSLRSSDCSNIFFEPISHRTNRAEQKDGYRKITSLCIEHLFDMKDKYMYI
ncbi:hypothetical protein EGW08_003263 [Elysia chlorotica]|uniref:Uncharacterized protein n=1 Tax=Elysia chlorotica TaxID=188477 RepID=A0A433U5A2_ELYCH|nr:hypothetical protein EGW08_003263 [Elysia chlorotica]